MALIFLLIVALQTALIHFHNFSPFERESNLRALAWGARPAPRYWAVLALDLLTWSLLALLLFSFWPRPAFSLSPALAPAARLTRALFLLALAALLSALVHHFLNHAVVCFPNPARVAKGCAAALVVGAGSVTAMITAIAVAAMPDWRTALAVLARYLPAHFAPAYLLALLVFVLRALSFGLRAIPVGGSFAHAVTSTLLLLWLVQRYARGMEGTISAVSGGPVGYPGLHGLEGAALVLGGLALGTLVLVWRLPGPRRRADAVDPPPLVVGPPVPGNSTITITDSGATISSSRMRAAVTCSPFTLRVQDTDGRGLWQLEEDGLRGDLLLVKVVSIPVLYTGNTIKVKWQLGGWPAGPAVRIGTEGDSLVVPFRGGVLRLTFPTEDILRMEFSTTSPWASGTSVLFTAPPDAHYLGFGQRFNRLDHQEGEIYFLVEEGGVGYGKLTPILKHIWGERGSWPNGEYCTGFPVPFCIICREQGPTVGLFWNTYRPSWVRLKRPDGRNGPSLFCLTVPGRRLDLYFLAGPTPLEVIRQYTSLTGRPDVPPAWAFLPWKTRTGPVTEADVFEDIRKFRELAIPLAHVGVEHWQEVRGSYEFSRRWYPHIDDLIATARRNGMRITAWHFPYMNAGSETHREGVRRGYFLLNRVGLPYYQRIFQGIATVIDYTNPHAAAWHESIVQERVYRRGFQGTMSDYGESVPPDCICYNGENGLAGRNAYPVLYVQSMQRAAREVLGDDHIVYPRAGYAGSQRFVTLQWPGDQDTDWDDGDGLPAAVRAMLNISMSGFPVHGSDIGGWYDWFTPPTTKELFIRWAEVGAYSPLMRAHGGPIGRNREPWKFDEETVEIYRRLSEEHVCLFPYLYTLAHEAHRTGIPIIRHPALIWPDVSELYEVEDAWMIGDALYVAPVVRPGLRRREVILPPGDWWSLNDGRPLRGPTRVMVEAPLGQTPRFLRRGFLLPRRARAVDTFDPTDPSAYLARVGSPDDDLEVWVYWGSEAASFLLFTGDELRIEADGTRTEVLGHRRVAWKIITARSE